MEFFSKDDLRDELVCAICKNQFDTPKALPCGNVICVTCESAYFKSSKRKHCELCQDYHDVPPNGFPVNNLIKNLLNKKPTKVCRGELHEKTMKTINEIGALNRMYGFDESSYVKSMVTDHCDLLRNQVDIKTESAIDAIQKHRETFLSEINEYQKKCLANCDNLDEFKAFIAQSKESYINWSKFINRADITDAEIDAVLKESTQLVKRFKSNQKKLDTNIYDIQKLYFHENEKEISSAVIGKLKQSSLNSLIENKSTLEINYKTENHEETPWHPPILLDIDEQRVCIAYTIFDDDSGYVKLKLFSKDGILIKEKNIEIDDDYGYGIAKFKENFIIQITLPEGSHVIQVYNHDLELVRIIDDIGFYNSKVFTDNNRVYFYSIQDEEDFWYVYDENLNQLESINIAYEDIYPFITDFSAQIELKYGRIFINSFLELKVVDNETRKIIETIKLDEIYANQNDLIMKPLSSESFMMIERESKQAKLFDLDLQCLKEFTIQNISDISTLCTTDDNSIGIFDTKAKKAYLF